MKVILVVESDETMMENIGEILEISGYQVEYAVDGLEGLQKVFSILPDLVICDVSLPGISGSELRESVKLSPKSNDIPFILLTPNSEVEDSVQNIDFGADSYLAIPFEYEHLISAVDHHLKPRHYSLKNVQ